MADEPIRNDDSQGGETGVSESEVPAGKEEGERRETKESAPEIPSVLPLLPVRDIVIFPFMTPPPFRRPGAAIPAVDTAPPHGPPPPPPGGGSPSPPPPGPPPGRGAGGGRPGGGPGPPNGASVISGKMTI